MGGEGDYIPITNCHHQNDPCIKMGSDESHSNVSVGSGGQSHKTVSTNHNLFEEKGEPKRYQTEVLPLTSLTPYRLAKPAHMMQLVHTKLLYIRAVHTNLPLYQGSAHEPPFILRQYTQSSLDIRVVQTNLPSYQLGSILISLYIRVVQTNLPLYQLGSIRISLYIRVVQTNLPLCQLGSTYKSPFISG